MHYHLIDEEVAFVNKLQEEELLATFSEDEIATIIDALAELRDNHEEGDEGWIGLTDLMTRFGWVEPTDDMTLPEWESP